MSDKKTYSTQAYNKVMDTFIDFPDLLPRIIEKSAGNPYKLKTIIHNVYDVRLPVQGLKKAAQSPNDLKELIANAYANKQINTK